MEWASFYDTLTGIYNRNKFNQVIEDYGKKEVKNIGVVYFDINGLKPVNDKIGHEAGDNLIKETAAAINQVFQKYAYRIGGDEFIVIMDNIGEKEFDEKVKEVCQLMKHRKISVSSGLSWRENNHNLEEQVKEADERMYADKKRHYAQLR